MESFGRFGFNDISKTIRKKRSNSSRRPRNDSQSFADCGDFSSLSSSPYSDSVSRASSDDNKGHGTNYCKKELSLNQCNSRASSTNLVEAETALRMNNNNVNGGEFKETCIKRSSKSKDRGKDSKRCSEGVLAPSNRESVSKVKEGVELQSEAIETQISRRVSGRYSSSPYGRTEVASEGPGSDNKVKTVKFKVGGVTRMLHANSTSGGASVGGSSSAKSSRSSDAPRPRQKLILEDTSENDQSSSPDKGAGLLGGSPCNEFSRSISVVMNANSSRGQKTEESVSTKQLDKYEPVRKSKRVPKRRFLDGVLDDGDDDEELRCLEKLKSSKVTKYSAEYGDDIEVGSRKRHKISKVLRTNVTSGCNASDYGSFRSGKEARKSRSGGASDDTDYMEDEEVVSDGEAETKRRKQRKDLVDLLGDSTRDMAVTTRQRALQTGKDISSSSGASLIEFPNGLPPAAPRKQKEKLSEVDQQLKKAEAAQRRRMQVEKAARESEAEAIRKILGQDSSRKKREDKMKQRQEELAQERANSAMTLTSNTVRWVIGPMGTIVTFSNEMGLPSIFEPKACSYPPPRERCAGPSCTNPFKYRDSKSKLPLCSLQCYKAVHEKMRPVTAY